jgi:TrmH family RNA methyltransferase
MTSNLVTLVRNLQRRKGRKRSGSTVAEGVRLVEEALAAGVGCRGVLVDREFGRNPRGAQLLEQLAAHAVQVEEIAERELKQLADTDTPQGIVAVITPPTWTLAEVKPAPSQPVIVLDCVQDPGNVGTLLRTAFALGSAGAILLPGTADLFNPKVIRAGMGATFRLPTAPAQDGEFAAWLERHGADLWAAAGEGTSLGRLRPPEHLAVVVGNEGAGVRPLIRSMARHSVAIPLARGAESLNVAVAAGILLHEVRRGT